MNEGVNDRLQIIRPAGYLPQALGVVTFLILCKKRKKGKKEKGVGEGTTTSFLTGLVSSTLMSKLEINIFARPGTSPSSPILCGFFFVCLFVCCIYLAL